MRLDKRNEVNHSKVVPDTSRLFTKTKDKAEVQNQAKIVELNPTPNRHSSFYNNQKVLGILRKNTPFSSMNSNIFSFAKHATDEKPKEYMGIQFINDNKNPTNPAHKKRNLKERFISYSSIPKAALETPEDELDILSSPYPPFAKADREFLSTAKGPRIGPMNKSTQQFFHTMLSIGPPKALTKTTGPNSESYKFGSKQGKVCEEEGGNPRDSALKNFLDTERGHEGVEAEKNDRRTSTLNMIQEHKGWG